MKANIANATIANATIANANADEVRMVYLPRAVAYYGTDAANEGGGGYTVRESTALSLGARNVRLNPKGFDYVADWPEFYFFDGDAEQLLLDRAKVEACVGDRPIAIFDRDDGGWLLCHRVSRDTVVVHAEDYRPLYGWVNNLCLP